MLTQVISGGQAGADIGGVKAAKDMHVMTGGWMPQNFITENGMHPEYAALYSMKETDTIDYLDRTFRNVQDSDATIWFGKINTHGYHATARSCIRARKPFMVFDGTNRTNIASFIAEHSMTVINITGNRESGNPGIEEMTYKEVTEIIRILDALGRVLHVA